MRKKEKLIKLALMNLIETGEVRVIYKPGSKEPHYVHASHDKTKEQHHESPKNLCLYREQCIIET